MGKSTPRVRITDLDPWENLANAVVLQAVADWRKAAKRVKANPNNKSARWTMDEVEQFFQSQWMEQLTDLKGEYLLRRLRKEAGIS